MKKLFLLLSLFLGAHSVWAHDVEVNGIFYNLIKSNQCATVTFQGEEYNSVQNEYKGDVVVPATFTFDGVVYSVTGVEGHSFRDCTELTSVTLPNSVKTIGAECFSKCSSLTSVKLPNSISDLEDYCFSDCPSLASIYIPESGEGQGTGHCPTRHPPLALRKWYVNIPRQVSQHTLPFIFRYIVIYVNILFLGWGEPVGNVAE